MIKLRTPRIAWLIVVALLVGAPLLYVGGNALLRTASTTPVTSPTTSSSTSSTTPGSEQEPVASPSSDDAAVNQCNERLAGYKAASVDEVTLDRAYLANARTVLRYQRSLHRDSYKTPLSDLPPDSNVAVCWFGTTGYAFSPNIGEEHPLVDRVVDAITKDGLVIPLIRGTKADFVPRRPG